MTKKLVVVQTLSLLWLFVTPWTATHQASLFSTISWSLLKLMSIESVMPSNCSAHSLGPWLGKKTPRNNATCNRGIYYWLEPGPPSLTKGVRTKRPWAPVLRYLLGQKKAAGSWCKRIGCTVGSWRKRIGYTVARQFLLAQREAFSFPLIGSLFLARHMLIG